MFNRYQEILSKLRPVDDMTRGFVADVTGITNYCWEISENFGSMQAGRTRMEVSPHRRTDALGSPVEKGTIEFTWPERPLACGLDAKVSLWARLFIDPIAWLSPVDQKAFGYSCRLAPPPMEARLKGLNEIFQAIEDVALSVEFLWLDVSSPEYVAALLIHSVRGRIENVGVLDISAGAFDRKNWDDVERVDRYFGTRTLFIRLKVSPFIAKDPCVAFGQVASVALALVPFRIAT